MLIRSTAAPFLLLAVLGAAGSSVAAEARRPNVLMIWVDDLRPELACFGADGVSSPNIDRLAARSVRFNRAYCNVPVCGASRASTMSGLRGTRDRFFKFDARVDEESPAGTAPLNRLFKDAGYHTASFGKVLHVDSDSNDGWTENPGQGSHFRYTLRENQRIVEPGDGPDHRPKKRGPAWERADATDEELPDGKVMTEACDAIGRLAGGEKPFFIAAGFYKPHLPFIAPASRWENYPAADQLLPANYRTRPNAPKAAFSNWGELRNYFGMPKKGPLSDADALEMLAGYRACVSHVDAMIGRVLDSLEASGAGDNTIVVLLGDHGWHLGEHGIWGKHCLFENAMRTPLLFSAPMLDGFASGEATEALAEFIDIYPTLCELTGVAPPAHLAGKSFANVLSRPQASYRDAAIGRFRTGETIRTDRFRYSFYQKSKRELGHMLYDHDADPAEDHNLADDPAYADVVDDLRGRLMATIVD